MTKEIYKYPYNARTEDEIKVFLSDKICEQVVKVNYKNGQIFCTIKDRITSKKKEIMLSAAVIFGATGGVMEAALRTAYFTLTGKEMDDINFQPVRGLTGIKEAVVHVADMDVKVAAVNSLKNIKPINRILNSTWPEQEKNERPTSNAQHSTFNLKSKIKLIKRKVKAEIGLENWNDGILGLAEGDLL